ncbi:hypothetical protein BDF14DRAFT_1878291 [Spinellus fusiger]|nr:hypothetical protein BDF14DRAFT_1878291 [Spinellus fusiger]
MLRPLYTHRATHLLIVGPVGSGKRTLSRQLLRSPDIFYSVHIAETVCREKLDSLMKIDCVVLVVDRTNRTSLGLLRESLQTLSPHCLTLQCCVVVTKGKWRSVFTFDVVGAASIALKDLHFVTAQCPEMQFFHANLEDTLERRKVCAQLVRFMRVSAFQQRHLSPVVLRSVTACLEEKDDLPYI